MKSKEKFEFYYDETEHSRVISQQTISTRDFYDGFVVAVVGWRQQDKEEIQERFRLFSEKHGERKTGGEFKSTTIKQARLKSGFASLGRGTASFINDFLKLFDEKILIYFSTFSKIEHVVEQLLADYNNSPFINMDNAKYSLVKAIALYRPTNVLAALYSRPDVFIKEVKIFLLSRIKEDMRNRALKHREIEQFQTLLFLLDNATEIKSFNWDYRKTLIGFQNFIEEKQISRYSLIIDREANTANAARDIGLSEVKEGDSKDCFALQMADLLAGIIAKIMRALSESLRYKTETEAIKKHLLEEEWFNLTEERLVLYKRLHKIINLVNNSWYKSYAGRYADDLVCLIALLNFFDQFKTADELKHNLKARPEQFNALACAGLERHFHIMQDDFAI